MKKVVIEKKVVRNSVTLDVFYFEREGRIASIQSCIFLNENEGFDFYNISHYLIGNGKQFIRILIDAIDFMSNFTGADNITTALKCFFEAGGYEVETWTEDKEQ